MSIRILYFASLREHIGRSGDEIPSEGIRTVADVWNRAIDHPAPANTLAAINMEYAGFDAPVHDGDEIGFFPPVTGGQAGKIEVSERPFDPWDLLRHHEALLATNGGYGATAVFIGTLRDFNEGDSVRAMRLEHYPGMTERYLAKISAEALQRWELVDTLVVHRVGDLTPNEPIVLIAVWSAHRAEAFAACRYLIEELKSRAPFWKKETLAEGERWVEHNTPA